MANFIFTFFEGQHDANFVARLLCESKKYTTSKLAVKEFPTPIRSFLENLYSEGGVEDIRVGEYNEKLAPVVALINGESETHVLSFVTGGCTKKDGAISIIKKIMAFAQRDEIGALTAQGHRFAILFFFDADTRGIGAVEKFFATTYSPTFEAYGPTKMPAHRTWAESAGVPVGLYVFCDGTGTGTLEDCIETALVKHDGVMKVAEAYLRDHHVDLPFSVKKGDDEVAARAKTHKAKFTVLGQRERALAGSSLAVTLRRSSMLDDAFDFDGVGFPAQIMAVVEGAFSNPPVVATETIVAIPAAQPAVDSELPTVL